MACLLPPLCSISSSPSSAVAVVPNPATRLHSNWTKLNFTCSYGVQICSPVPKIPTLIARATGVDAVEQPAEDEGQEGLSSEEVKESKSVQNLPLESKLQMIAEQRAKMKIAKKIRLRKARLVRKRKMRKKGRWPPSKMKKLKNV